MKEETGPYKDLNYWPSVTEIRAETRTKAFSQIINQQKHKVSIRGVTKGGRIRKGFMKGGE